MVISVLGTGRMGKGLVKSISPHVEKLLWGSRSVEKAQTLAEEGKYTVVPVSYEEAIKADVIIHSFWFKDLLPWLEKHRKQLEGKIFVDIVNPFSDDFSDFTLPWGTSAAEEVQKVVPRTRIVGAFKNTFWSVFDEPVHNGSKSDVFVTSDDQEAKDIVMNCLQKVPFRFLDAGFLRNNRTIERMTLFERELAIRYGHYPHVSFQLWGNNET